MHLKSAALNHLEGCKHIYQKRCTIEVSSEAPYRALPGYFTVPILPKGSFSRLSFCYLATSAEPEGRVCCCQLLLAMVRGSGGNRTINVGAVCSSKTNSKITKPAKNQNEDWLFFVYLKNVSL